MEESVRIVVLDYYMTAPTPGLDVTYSEFRGTSISQLPVLRCFGSIKNGKKICVHIHGVFPYLYIPYDGRGKPEELMHQIAVALDKAINISFNQGSSNNQHVYKILLVSGIPMYGYHPNKHQFFKIYLYNPKLIAKVGSLLLNKNILGQIFQPHESHLNFTLQFMIDYNLHGMSNMDVTNLKYRVTADSIISEQFLLSANIEKTTTCELEGDVNAENILNRQEILSGNLAVNPGIAALWEDEKQRRRNKQEESQLGDFLELKNMNYVPTKTHLLFQQALRDRFSILSTDKDLPQDKYDASVYPAETPSNSNIQNASLIDIHSSSSLELSLDDTFNMTFSQGLNETIIPSQSNMTLDEDAQEFLHLLEQLADEKVGQHDNEDLGILSQVVPEEPPEDSKEDFLDLSLPLASLTTPTKSNPHHFSDHEGENDYFNTTLVPQLDGQDDCLESGEGEIFNEIEPGPSKTPCGKSMPLLSTDQPHESSCSLNNFNWIPYVQLSRLEMAIPNGTRQPKIKKKYNKRSVEEILKGHLKRISFRIDRISTRIKVKRIGKILRSRDLSTINFLQKRKLCPKFVLKPGRTERPISNPDPTIISRLLELTNNYTDPNLHSIVRTPSLSYLFYYGGNELAETVEIPSDLSFGEMRFLLGTFNYQERRDKWRTKIFRMHGQILNVRNQSKHNPKLAWTKIENDLEIEAHQATCRLRDHHQFLREFGSDAADSDPQADNLSDICCLKPNTVESPWRKYDANKNLIVEDSDSAISAGDLCSASKYFKRSTSRDSDYISDSDLGAMENRCEPNDKQKIHSINSKLPFFDGRCIGNGIGTEERMSKPNMYINCDGAADSSSDEEQVELKGRNLKKKPRYDPLGITVTKSPLLRTNTKGLAVNALSISGNQTDNQADQLISTEPHKRKLLFDHSATITEEFTECTFSPKAPDIIEPVNSQSFYSSSSDLFSDNDEFNQSVFKLTTSEKYDVENKYKAKEGCSRIFSPGSLPNSTSQETSSAEIPVHQVRKNKIIQPLLKAPTRFDVEQTLVKYKIPRVQQQEPFYSNINDYTGVVEVGHRVMRIPSKTTAHLTEFESEFDGLNRHRKKFVEEVAQLAWNDNNVKSLKLSHCSNRLITIQPLKKAPTVKEVREWLEVNSLKQTQEDNVLSIEAPKVERKMHIQSSQGEGDSYFDLSLSLSPPNVSTSNSLDASQSTSSPVFKGVKLKEGALPSDESNQSCQISGLTQQNSFGFNKSVQNLQAVRAVTEHQYLTTLVMEMHIRTRANLKPDPQFDCICAIFYSIFHDAPESNNKKSKARGVVAVNSLPSDLGQVRNDILNGIGIDCDITLVETEEALVKHFVSIVTHWDPDILAGYEIEMLSWGFLVERSFVLSINILPMLSRSELHKYGKAKLKTLTLDLESNVIGRIVLDVWRIMRHEIALQSYTFESIVYSILQRRVSMFHFKELSFWWDHRSNIFRHRVVKYYIRRVDTILELFDKLDFLNRTSELAKLFGILFFEVLSRGTQFRVESMMLRLAKPLNYVPVSPDVKQRAHMKAPEYISLVMEPESKLYTDPVVVLDFQSLYPSIIIAYNYCFTTCLGRVNNLGTDQPFEFGATQLRVSKKIVSKLCHKDLLNYSPCGVAFVRQKVREGILPRMLKEVLDTRLMVKNSMKENKGNNSLQKVLHNRQLGLKLIANVTYGYTAANFSGRMCCVEVGDSVVSKGRETLQRAIALVENTPEWEAKVVYGDTDSMFVLVPGKTREEAFEVGARIADAVTADNPDPVKLKLEKVYQPCILQTKKRYVGYMYESPDQTEPVYEAKGIETVRRDGCPAVAKMLQKCLTLLFETKDVSLIKRYVLKQFNKIQMGRASLQDLTFAKEYRGADGYKPGACVPALELARKWKMTDRRNEPRSGERVPYVIVNGPPGLPLIRLVRSPRELLQDTSLTPNALYYITKVIIPPINRCLNLIGADLNLWFNQMPRKHTQYLPNSSPVIKSTIAQYFTTRICASCTEPTQDGLCGKCSRKPQVTAVILNEKLKKWEENYHNTLLICQSCTGYLDEIHCASLDCPVLYRRHQTFQDLQQSTYLRDLLDTSSIFSDPYF